MQAELLSFLNQQLPSTLQFLQQMVAINSFTTNKNGIEKLSLLTEKAFAPLGFKAERVPSVKAEYASHLVLTRPGSSGRVLGMISHLDTVFPPEEETRNNFVWRREGDKIYGPGIMDIKGGTVMMHLVLTALQKFAPAVFNEMTWVLLLNSSEEIYSHDFGDLCLKKLGKDCLAALVFESGVKKGNEFLMVAARKGRAVYRIAIEGRGAHAGSHHERGANAIVQIAETIKKIAAMTDYSKDLTFNVSNVSGGTVLNRVPHEATAEGEMRCFRSDVFRDAINRLTALQSHVTVRAPEDNHPCSVSIEVVRESPPWPRNDGTEKLLNLWQQSARQVGCVVLPEERGGLSDGNFTCHAVPTLDGLGPNGDNAHCSEQSADGTKEQEYVDVTSFVPKAAMNVLSIIQLAGGK